MQRNPWRLHYEWKGKIEVIARAKVDNKDAPFRLLTHPALLSRVLKFRRDINKS